MSTNAAPDPDLRALRLALPAVYAQRLRDAWRDRPRGDFVLMLEQWTDEAGIEQVAHGLHERSSLAADIASHSPELADAIKTWTPARSPVPFLVVTAYGRSSGAPALTFGVDVAAEAAPIVAN